MSEDERIMEKYRGPSRQYPKIERKYMLRLLGGIFVILMGVIGSAVNVELSQETIMVQGPDPGAGPSEIESGIEITRTAGIIALLSGGVINLWSINKYRDEYAEVKETEQRPEMLFILGGLIVTTVALVIAASYIFGVFIFAAAPA